MTRLPEACMAQEALTRCLPPGALVGGRYVTQTVLGQGGSGITYECRDLEKGETVALKELFVRKINTRGPEGQVLTAPGEEERFDRARRRLRREEGILRLAQAAAPEGVVHALDYLEEKGTAYLVMERLEGISLRRCVSGAGPLSPEKALALLAPLCRTLERLHRAGIIHKDVAPDNIICLKDGGVRLLDFGGSVLPGDTDILVSYRRGYAPPEQYLAKGPIGPWTDVYGLAATLLFTLTGQKPPDAMDRKVGVELPPLPEGSRPELEKALELNPEARFGRMEDFYEAVFR